MEDLEEAVWSHGCAKKMSVRLNFSSTRWRLVYVSFPSGEVEDKKEGKHCDKQVEVKHRAGQQLAWRKTS